MTEFGSLNHSPGKRVLNDLKEIYLKFGKDVLKGITVIKFRVNNRCGMSLFHKSCKSPTIFDDKTSTAKAQLKIVTQKMKPYYLLARVYFSGPYNHLI